MSLQHKSYFFFLFWEPLEWFYRRVIFRKSRFVGPTWMKIQFEGGVRPFKWRGWRNKPIQKPSKWKAGPISFLPVCFQRSESHVCLQIQLGCSSTVISHSMWAPKTNFCQVFVKNSVLHYYLQHSFKLNEKHSFELNETPVNQMWLNSFRTRLNSHSKLGFSLLSLDVFFGNYYFLNSVYLVGTWLHSTLHPITT